MQTNGRTPLALYIHIPYCSKKCHYCSFYTVPFRQDWLDIYCQSVIQEGKRKLDSLKNEYFIDTVFFGGGTPSLVPPEYLQRMLESLTEAPNEVTLEANPENLSLAYLQSLERTQINRVSIGVQTFHDPLLQVLGREHSADKAKLAVRMCSDYISNISIDLIYGLPNQEVADVLVDVRTALNLPISHISLYNLTIDPRTSFYKHRRVLQPSLASDEDLASMSLLAESFLEEKGFARYELASYAKGNAYSRHNVYYWTDKPYLGLGVSASQYLHGTRSRNYSHIAHYLRAVRKHLPTEEFSETLSDKERMKEALALRLRLIQGAVKADFPAPLISALLSSSRTQELLDANATHVFLNRRGRLFHDFLAEEIMAIEF